jgi:hypothetical protein
MRHHGAYTCADPACSGGSGAICEEHGRTKLPLAEAGLVVDKCERLRDDIPMHPYALSGISHSG